MDMTSMDMNESAMPQEVNDGVPLETLVYIIGTHEVERYVYEQQAKKIQQQALEVQQQNVLLKAELESLRKKLELETKTVPDSVTLSSLQAENERLVKVNASDDERIKQLEDTLHKVAMERDAIAKERDAVSLESNKKIAEFTAQIETLKVEVSRHLS